MKQNQQNITELSDVIATALAQNPGLIDRLSALQDSRENAAVPGKVGRKYISMNERRRLSRQKFAGLHQQQLKKQSDV